MKKLTADVILIAALVLVGGIFGGVLLLRSGTGACVEITVSGGPAQVYSLKEDRTLTIEGKSGTNQLIIENGEAWLTDATCPDKLCVHMGKIRKDGQSIICLPNQVVITVRSDAPEDTNEIDAVSGGRE